MPNKSTLQANGCYSWAAISIISSQTYTSKQQPAARRHRQTRSEVDSNNLLGLRYSYHNHAEMKAFLCKFKPFFNTDVLIDGRQCRSVGRTSNAQRSNECRIWEWIDFICANPGKKCFHFPCQLWPRRGANVYLQISVRRADTVRSRSQRISKLLVPDPR